MEPLIQTPDVCFLCGWLQSWMFLVIFTIKRVTLNLEVTESLWGYSDIIFSLSVYSQTARKLLLFLQTVWLRQHWWLWGNMFESEEGSKKNKVFVQSSGVPGRYMMESCISRICVWIQLYYWIISVDLITF